ncbi:CPBP family intramembrane glutamic endopeptidase [Peribacillus simplex]|uniref:CPBP family intramembrane glutamic endopeptidase n=1 Tax=Peribacillus simplex TaxID=1478 RepID=UPI0035CCF6B5
MVWIRKGQKLIFYRFFVKVIIVGGQPIFAKNGIYPKQSIGFLIYALVTCFQTMSIWFDLLLSSMLFGLVAHTYQGVSGVISSYCLVGLWFSIVYVGLGSIIPLIIFHALVEYFGKTDEEIS